MPAKIDDRSSSTVVEAGRELRPAGPGVEQRRRGAHEIERREQPVELDRPPSWSISRTARPIATRMKNACGSSYRIPRSCRKYRSYRVCKPSRVNSPSVTRPRRAEPVQVELGQRRVQLAQGDPMGHVCGEVRRVPLVHLARGGRRPVPRPGARAPRSATRRQQPGRASSRPVSVSTSARAVARIGARPSSTVTDPVVHGVFDAGRHRRRVDIRQPGAGVGHQDPQPLPVQRHREPSAATTCIRRHRRRVVAARRHRRGRADAPPGTGCRRGRPRRPPRINPSST